MSATTAATAPRMASRLGAALMIGAGLMVLVALFLPECRAAVGVWVDSTAYGHCFLVIPIALYLLWDRRDSLRGMAPRPTASLLLVGLPLPFAWFAAERLGIMEGRQLAALGFVELLFLVVLGWRLFRASLAPLAYLVFLVPFGAFITPVLQSFTAHFIDVGLSVLGIPHFVSDMTIEISAGAFFVAEACAGLRFLIASIAFGVFYALLNYRSPGRRIAFIAASILVPILANGLRALGIVVLGSILGSAEAAAADHIIYGWVFFSIVMLLLVMAGLPLREPPPGPRLSRAGAVDGPAPQPWSGLFVLALAALAPAAAVALDRQAPPPALARPLVFTAPAGCSIGPAQDPTADHVGYTMQCGSRPWAVDVRAVSPRSTGASLAEARRRMLGPLDLEEATVMPLRGAPETGGNWQVTVSHDPGQVTGIAAWVDGRPAAGGLSQRLRQAQDSVFGSVIPPLVIGLTTTSPRSLSETQADAAVAELGRFVAAQPNLNAAVQQLTAPSSPPLRP